MVYQIEMGLDNILRITLSGNLDRTTLGSLKREFIPYVEASTIEKPLKNIVFTQNLQTLSNEARKYFMQLSRDPRYGQTAFINPSPRAKVLGIFINKAVGKQKIHFFNSEDIAIGWLKQTNNGSHPST